MLLNRRTGVPMEVDTVIRPNTAGYEVVVSVEAIARARKAGPGWVNEMVGKHEDLPTSKLILLSESGFTDTGRELALAKDAVPIAPETCWTRTQMRSWSGQFPRYGRRSSRSRLSR